MTWSVRYGGKKQDDTVTRNVLRGTVPPIYETLVLECACRQRVSFPTTATTLVFEVYGKEEAPDREIMMKQRTTHRCSKCGTLYVGFHQ